MLATRRRAREDRMSRFLALYVGSDANDKGSDRPNLARQDVR